MCAVLIGREVMRLGRLNGLCSLAIVIRYYFAWAR